MEVGTINVEYLERNVYMQLGIGAACPVVL
jgi:hypothetical protein